jgi:hypothetical protein
MDLTLQMIEPSNLGLVYQLAHMYETSPAMDTLTDFPGVTFTKPLRKDDVIIQHVREASGDETRGMQPRGDRVIFAVAGVAVS